MMGQDEDQEEGEGGENFVDQVIRSLPDDTTSLVTNHLKDVLVWICAHTLHKHTHTHTHTHKRVHTHTVS